MFIKYVSKHFLALGIVLAMATAATAQTFTSLVSFNGTNGNQTLASLVQGTDGNLYGTALYGGANGAGTVFQMTPTGTLTTLYSFCSQPNCPDGSAPDTVPALGTDNDFYGVTSSGGANNRGTVFKSTSAGTLTTLHSFDGSDGNLPAPGPVQATNGNFYGETESGGAHGDGTIFEITSTGTLTTLYSFCAQTGCTDGFNPCVAMVQATNGNFYGATCAGGTSNDGTIFAITETGTLTTLYSFDGTHGETPRGVVQATDGNFDGTTYLGGVHGDGTVFKITSAGALTTLYNFNGTDGANPRATVVQATDGNFYGTTEAGGSGNGTIFEITSTGALTTLHIFDGTDGEAPRGLVQDTNGTFYGTTRYGGASGDGTVFSLSLGLGPFVETLPTSGKVGTAVKILGTNLTGATTVSFNGTAATFRVVSRSLIAATVPTGAATGTVQVTTTNGTLNSNVVFRVMP